MDFYCLRQKHMGWTHQICQEELDFCHVFLSSSASFDLQKVEFWVHVGKESCGSGGGNEEGEGVKPAEEKPTEEEGLISPPLQSLL